MARNVGAAALQRIKNLAKETGLDVQSLVRRYAQERLVYRLSISDAADSFCLKGGLLLSLYNGGRLLRPTDDVDFNGFDGDGDVRTLEETLRRVLSMPVEDDGVDFKLETMQISKDRTGVVPGGKVSIVAFVGSARANVRVDVGFGNPITPTARRMEIPTILEGMAPRPVIAAYPLETVVAEKLHAMVEFGMINTRIKDYYDVWMLLRLHLFSGNDLAEAIKNTFEHQRRAVPERIEGLTEDFATNNEPVWRRFLSKVAPDLDVSLADTIKEIDAFLSPVLARVRGQSADPGEWRPANGWVP